MKKVGINLKGIRIKEEKLEICRIIHNAGKRRMKCMNKQEFIIYGLGKVQSIIEIMIQQLGCEEHCFDMKLLLMEGIVNAHTHGNGGDGTKPIVIRCFYDLEKIRVEIQDCGCGGETVHIPTVLSEDGLLKECGRGLFIIQSLADQVEFRNGTLILEKKIEKKSKV